MANTEWCNAAPSTAFPPSFNRSRILLQVRRVSPIVEPLTEQNGTPARRSRLRGLSCDTRPA